ncbi:MAG: dihydroorotate dehydrogenase [Planctomycetes bacterium]|nr:dihydroorotate dehydrogenase [Planctomycetota bacterium]
MARLAVHLPPLALRNPILSASGTYGHAAEMQHMADIRAIGGLVSKTVTRLPRHGNPAPRICETEAGFLNSIGLENKGLDYYVRELLPQMAEQDTCVITNIGAERVEDFVELAARLSDEPAVDALEVNLSCPNVQEGKLPFATDARMAARVIEEVKRATKKPIFAKLSPNVSRISEMAIAVEAAGADAITAVNTVLGMQVNWRTGKPGLHTVQGGYSGTAIKPIALRCAWECARSVSIPIIGCGGITTAHDVLEFMVVGCTAVQIGTASFGDPGLVGRLAGEVEALLDSAGIDDVNALIGTLRTPQATPRATRPHEGQQAPCASKT